MLLRLAVAAMVRWHELTGAAERDRGDSPVPTVIIWVGIAVVAVALVGWAADYITGFTDAAPDTGSVAP
jgi:hypothetical protein